MTHWADFNVITAEAYYQLSLHHPNAMPREQLTGEIVRLQARKPAEATWEDTSWLAADTAEALAQHTTVSTHLWAIRRRITLDALKRDAVRRERQAVASYD